MPPLAEFFLDDGPTLAASLARHPGVHKLYYASGTRSLGNTEGLELSPASIKDRLIQTSFGAGSIRKVCAFVVRVGFRVWGSAHIENLQIFKDERTKAIHQGTRRFVLQVFALIPHLAMRFC